MKNKKDVICLTIMLISIAVITFSITYAYLAPIIGSGEKTNVNIQSGTVDALTFDKCDPINLVMTQSNFTSGGNNLEASTCVKAKLSANNTTNTATDTYNVYFEIKTNNFAYSTIEKSFLGYERIYKEGNEAEIILQVTDPLGNEITNIEGLPYVTQKGISGFDITTRLGLIKIAENYEISVTSATPKTDEWQIKVILVNLETNQSANADKEFKAEGIIQKETKKDKVVEVYLGDVSFDGIIDTTDSSIIYNYINQYTDYQLTEAQKLVSDVNQDGEITETDYQIIMNYVGYYEETILEDEPTLKIPLLTNGARLYILNNNEAHWAGIPLNELNLYIIKEDN